MDDVTATNTARTSLTAFVGLISHIRLYLSLLMPGGNALVSDRGYPSPLPSLKRTGAEVVAAHVQKMGWSEDETQEMLREEAARITGQNLKALNTYLKAERTGSRFLLNRRARAGIFCLLLEE